jgi:hypothetical protein
MSSSLVTVVHSNTLSHLQQAQLNSLHVQFVLVCFVIIANLPFDNASYLRMEFEIIIGKDGQYKT